MSISTVVEFPRKLERTKPRRRGQIKFKNREEEAAEANAFRLRTFIDLKDRAELEVESALRRLQVLKSDVARLQQKVGAKMTTAACTVDGHKYEVTFYDRDASDIHKLSQRRRRGAPDIIDTLRRRVWSDAYGHGNISEDLVKRIIAAAVQS
jgi:hypothetical protein